MFDNILRKLPGFKQPSAAQWSKAAAALTAGDVGLMADVLRMLDLPAALAEVFRVALSEAANLEAAIKADGAEELQKLEGELKQLRRTPLSTTAEASKRAERLAFLEKSIPPANNRAIAADYARRYLGTVHAYFPELFGMPGASAKVPSSAQLPPDVHNALLPFGINPFNQTWREFMPPAADPPPRRLRPTWFQPPKVQSEEE